MRKQNNHLIFSILMEKYFFIPVILSIIHLFIDVTNVKYGEVFMRVINVKSQTYNMISHTKCCMSLS